MLLFQRSGAKVRVGVFAGDRHISLPIYSLFGPAKLNTLDHEAYLGRMLASIADRPVNRAAKLLPWTLTPSIPGTLIGNAAVVTY